MRGILRKKFIWGRAFHLAQQKLHTLYRAIAQAALFYFLAIGILSVFGGLQSSRARWLIGAVIFACNVVFLAYCLLYFHRVAFEDVLFEPSQTERKRHYRGLGLVAKALWLLETILMTLRFITFADRTTLLASSIDFFEAIAIPIIAVPYFYYAIRYFWVSGHSIVISLSQIPDATIQIHLPDVTHEVNLRKQFVVELTSGNLLIAPIRPAVNPDFANTPPEYQVPLSALYVRAGEFLIVFDAEKKKWVKQLSPQS